MPTNAAFGLSPELKEEYQRIYQTPGLMGSAEWYVAANALMAAGVIHPEPDDVEGPDGAGTTGPRPDDA